MEHERIKLAHIAEALEGGVATYLRTVLPQLAEHGFDVTLVCSLNRHWPDAEDIISELETRGVNVHILPMSREINLGEDAISFLSLLRFLWKKHFDIVHTHSAKAGALGRLAAYLTGTRVLYHTPHCFAFLRTKGRLQKQLYLAVERILGRITTTLVAVSKSEESAALRYAVVPRSRCTIVNNGLPLEPSTIPTDNNQGTPIFSLNDSRPLVVTASRLVSYKGIHRFLEAAAMSSIADATFVVAGDGELRDNLCAFVNARGLSYKIKLLGHVTNMEQLYQSATVVVLCSDMEGQPYALLEAMRAGCAIVATNVPGNCELISHGRTGYLVEPAPTAVAEAVDFLLAHEDQRRQCATNARQFFRQHHCLSKQIKILTQHYADSLCAKGAKTYVPANRTSIGSKDN